MNIIVNQLIKLSSNSPLNMNNLTKTLKTECPNNASNIYPRTGICFALIQTPITFPVYFCPTGACKKSCAEAYSVFEGFVNRMYFGE